MASREERRQEALESRCAISTFLDEQWAASDGPLRECIRAIDTFALTTITKHLDIINDETMFAALINKETE